MEKLSRALCFSQDSSSEKSCKKTKEIMISETTEESLHNWKLPPFSASDIYEGTGIFNSSPIKTVEQEIPLSEGFATFPLFPDDLKRAFPKKFDFLHVGMIQVGLKPTKLGSNASASICLRDKTHLKFDRSVLGMVESSLCDGPIYFSYFPPDHEDSWFDDDVQSPVVSLSDDLSSSFSIDIKTEGSTTILMYRLHYRVLNHRCEPRTRDMRRYRVDTKGITTLFLTNVAQTNHAWPKKICCDEVAVPERWVDWKETAEARVLTVDVPTGFTKEEVKVEIEGGSIVRISGERNEEQEEKKDKDHRVERSSGKFLRRFTPPENVKVEELKAVVENGVVTVTVPNEEVNKKLEVKVVHSSG